MSELPAGIEPANEPEPRSSASGLVLRRAADAAWTVLLGTRSMRSRFMPGYLAFPGGRLEATDRASGGEEIDAFARCASRELLEETGCAVPSAEWIAAGSRITPSMFPLRFLTRFFVASAPADYEPPAESSPSQEMEGLRFEAPAVALAAWERGACSIPPPVLPMLRELAAARDEPLHALAARLAAANEREERAPRIEFSPGFWMLPVRTATLPPATHTNVWMPGGARFVLIDPGSTEPGERRRLLEVAARRRAGGAEPAAVLLTHHHRDHVGGARAAAAALDVPICAHPLTLERLPAASDAAEAAVRLEPLGDGARIDLDGVTLEALHTPGHADGHLAFRLAGESRVVVGDLIGGLSTILIDPDGGDMADYLASLERVRQLGAQQLLPGHGPPLPGRALDELIAHRREREALVLAQVAEGRRVLSAIATGAYADVPQMPSALTERQALAHLLHLERAGRVCRIDDDRTRWALPH